MLYLIQSLYIQSIESEDPMTTLRQPTMFYSGKPDLSFSQTEIISWINFVIMAGTGVGHAAVILQWWVSNLSLSTWREGLHLPSLKRLKFLQKLS